MGFRRFVFHNEYVRYLIHCVHMNSIARAKSFLVLFQKNQEILEFPKFFDKKKRKEKNRKCIRATEADDFSILQLDFTALQNIVQKNN